jgi:hypothetical protein
MTRPSEISAELEFRARANRGRRLMPRFLEEASVALGRTIGPSDVVSLEETDRVFSVFLHRWQAAKKNDAGRVHVVNDDPAVIRSIGQAIGNDMPATPLYLFRERSRWCGAIRASPAEIGNRVLELTSVDGEDVMASSEDGSVGIGCELFSAQVARTPRDTYELAAWWP